MGESISYSMITMATYIIYIQYSMVWGKNDVLFSCGLVRGFGPILLNEVDNSSKMFCHHNLLKFSFCC